ncbi:flagellar assembly peptidoglycan hydrolase FlgJ [Pseudoalteromonas sp. NBT06-2]|uniref:flagellar assembly peptidoglycan hydrolase FlgJ n=1 Tax=Pseudoalteromonas sp. NBT06-2 TaxID=2025950 RepID=UPI000BA77BDA|nr:flagellar assembly peptidoglycan hydrolase FlgJ [Pseudoalteromonas sp. NBT06-2]PAJ75137.1 flagellar assembly peptidoglycan hydrolase FlgJ [Pseudoalteromonas sp. NBT06-2]
MNEVNQQMPSNYFDLNSLNDLRRDATSSNGNDREALKKAAQHFEGIFMNMLMQSMRKANEAFESDSPMNSSATKFYEGMFDQQLTSNLSQSGSLGLADLIVQQLSPDYQSYKPASILRSDAVFNQTSSSEKDDVNNFVLQNVKAHSLPEKQSTPQWITDRFKQQQAEFLANKPQEKSPVERVESANFETPNDFINAMWQFAKKAAEKINLDPAVMVAQAALETGWGKHIINQPSGSSSNNLFNIKVDHSWQGNSVKKSTLEFEDGVAVKKNAAFRAYETIEDSFNDFTNFLRTGARYKDTLSKSSDPERFLHSLQKAGYATDPNYAEKIISILKSERFSQGLKQVLGN